MSSRPTPNIWQLQSRGDIQGILEVLRTSRSPNTRQRAVSALRALDAKSAIPHLQLIYKQEFNSELREAIAQTLQYLQRDDSSSPKPGTEQKTQLLQALRSGDNDKMISAIQALSELNDPTVVEDIVVVFQNNFYSPKVRLAAAEALLKLKSALASISLLGALRKDNWQVRRNSAAVLGQLKADWCVDPLIEVMQQDPHPIVRKTAAAALYRIKTPPALEAIRKSEFFPGNTGQGSGGTQPVLSIAEADAPTLRRPPSDNPAPASPAPPSPSSEFSDIQTPGWLRRKRPRLKKD